MKRIQLALRIQWTDRERVAIIDLDLAEIKRRLLAGYCSFLSWVAGEELSYA